MTPLLFLAISSFLSVCSANITQFQNFSLSQFKGNLMKNNDVEISVKGHWELEGSASDCSSYDNNVFLSAEFGTSQFNFSSKDMSCKKFPKHLQWSLRQEYKGPFNNIVMEVHSGKKWKIDFMTKPLKSVFLDEAGTKVGFSVNSVNGRSRGVGVAVLRDDIPPPPPGGPIMKKITLVSFLQDISSDEDNLLFDEDNIPEEGSLSIEGIDRFGFNSVVDSVLTYRLTGASFWPDYYAYNITNNGVQVNSSSVNITDCCVKLTSFLHDGLNMLSFVGYDSYYRQVYVEFEMVAGSIDFNVFVSVAPDTTVEDLNITIAFSDNDIFSASAVTNSLTSTFQNIPARTIKVSVTSVGGVSGEGGFYGGDSSGTVFVAGIKNEPSTIVNNDFSVGIEGWDVTEAVNNITGGYQLVEHVEGFPEFRNAGEKGPTSCGGCTERREAQEVVKEEVATMSLQANRIGEVDLIVFTFLEGEKSVFRTFTTASSTSFVAVRYRFITSEVPGGYYGSAFNDYCSVTLRTSNGYVQTESKYMNSLPYSAFHEPSGATDWFVMRAVVTGGDVVELKATVANVGDGLYDSQIVIDFVEEGSLLLTTGLAWDTKLGGLRVSYKVVGDALTEDVMGTLAWVSDAGVLTTIKQITFPAGSQPDLDLVLNVPGSELAGAPTNTKLISLATDDGEVYLDDVSIMFDKEKSKKYVSTYSRGVLKDLLRISGENKVRISRSAVTEAEQASDMFALMTRTDNVTSNILHAKNTYTLDHSAQVVKLFETEAGSKTNNEIKADRIRITGLMTNMIHQQRLVDSTRYRHVNINPALNVFDVRGSSFVSSTYELFWTAMKADPRVEKPNFVKYERDHLNVYHMQIPQPASSQELVADMSDEETATVHDSTSKSWGKEFLLVPVVAVVVLSVFVIMRGRKKNVLGFTQLDITERCHDDIEVELEWQEPLRRCGDKDQLHRL